jgi:predicted Zn finger-like uncharacterized protein
MQITCPNCSTSYQVTAASIGAAGRSVRCVRCKNKWFVSPQAEHEEPNWEVVAHGAATADAEAAAGEIAAFRMELAQESSNEVPIGEIPVIDDPSMMTEADRPKRAEAEVEANGEPLTYPNPFGEDDNTTQSEITIPAGDAPSLVPEPGDGGVADTDDPPVRRSKRRPLSRKKERRKFNPLPAIIVVLVCTVAALFSWRKDIVRHAPQMASLYGALGMQINLRGLSFTDIKITNDIYDGVPVIVVEGVIVSHANMAVDVPRLRFAVQNAAGHEVYTWTSVPTQPVLEPGARLPFKTRLASPPPDARNVVVRFFTRRDAVAGLR